MNDEMRARLKDVVDSVRFEEDSFVEAEPVQTEAFRYTDKETGLSFLVPANWEEKPMRQERQFLRCKFVSTEEPGVSIMYGGMDLWNAMSSAEKVGRTRADIDNSVFSAQEIAAVLGVSADEVETRTFGGKEYYLFEITSSANSYNISVTLTAAVRIENGTIYMIQFTGTGESPLYPDFEALLNSITYPESTETKRAEATPKPSIAPVVTVSMYPIQTAPQRSYGYDRYAARKPIYTLIGIALFALIPAFIAKKKGRSFWGYYFLCFLLSPLIVIIITLCLSDLTRAPRAVGQTTQYGQMWKYVCTNCGAGLQEPCTTCPYCGGVGFVRENRSAPYGQR